MTGDGARVDARLVTRVVRGVEVDEPRLFEDLLETWVEVSNAGGAVGFVPPTTAGEVVPTLARTLDRVRDGVDDLVVVRRGDGPDGPGRHVAMAVLSDGGSPLLSHWRTVLRVMVHPSLQGQGVGRQLMGAVHERAGEMGLDHLVLMVRTGQGIEPFYERLGYRPIGRHPRAIAVAPDDVRDEVVMFRDLRAAARAAGPPARTS